MSRLRILMLAVSAVLILLVGSVWLLPGLLDWNRYRDGIATLASARVGRPVHIGGAVTLHLLPQPILTAADVSVEDDGDGIGLKARALRLRVGLAALLSGTVDARELTLQGAELRLPWPPPPGALAQRPPSWITGLQARVEDGRLAVGALVLEHIDGTLSTDPDTGTLSAAGVGQAGPRRWQFTARLARPGRDGAAGLDVSLDGQGRLRDTGGTFSGQLGPDGALSGRVAGRGPDLSQLIPAPALAWRGDGRLGASAGLAVADDLALEIGGVPARGAIALRVTPQARLDLAIATGRLDLDAWLPALLAPPAMQPALPTGIDLSAEAASWAGGTLRRLRAALDLGADGMQLRDVSALLPGDAQIDLSGQVAGHPAVFTGPVRLAAPDLRGTQRWLQAVLPALALDLPEAALRRATLSARVVAGAGALAVSDLRGTLDGAAITGTAAARFGPRLALTAALGLDRLALDRWVPRAWRPPALRPETLGPLLAQLRQADADVKLQVEQASWSGAPLGAMTLDLQTEAGRIVLRRLEAQPLGARLGLSGQLAEGGRLTDGRLELAAPDLVALRPLSPVPLPPMLDRLLRGPGSAVLQAAGPPESLAARLTLELSDVRVELQPMVNLPARRAAGAVTIHHPGAPRLLETLGLGGTVSWLGDGSLSLVGQFVAAPGRLELAGATLAAGAARATGQLVLDGRRITGQVAAETLPLPAAYLRSPDPLPLAALRTGQAALRVDAAQVLVGLEPVLQSAGADLTLADGTLRLSRITGRAAGGTLAGTATLEAAADPPRLAVQGQATNLSIPAGLADMPIDLVAGQVDATLDITAAGHSPAALLATLDGTGTLRLQNGLAQGFDLAAATAALALPGPRDATEAARAALLGGTTPLTSAEARLALQRGVLSLEATLASDAGRGTLAGSIDLRDVTQDLRLGLVPGTDGAPTLGLRLTGPAASPTRTPELAALARFLAERPAPN